ncbi:unnamed protein product [Didymodactylos carnosus]|uniref:Uncharacterized protein n=1 Tax=Didymodactylos carnosus TaxID=1234261 RepID=A0A813V3L3_9BILA|nr:unnamed protein product [Didymodactylos carnosus]CAF3618976.1 unnamed protein product [Didymodactylos carnosus]
MIDSFNDQEQLKLLEFHSYFDPAGFSTLTDQEKRIIEQSIKAVVADSSFQSRQLLAAASQINSTTTNAFNKSKSLERSTKSATDMFNESIGEDSYAESVGDENKKATIINDMQNYRRYATQFI